ncbi:hypothetical protein GCM10027262_18980 [Nocardia tengchongensis]
MAAVFSSCVGSSGAACARAGTSWVAVPIRAPAATATPAAFFTRSPVEDSARCRLREVVPVRTAPESPSKSMTVTEFAVVR